MTYPAPSDLDGTDQNSGRSVVRVLLVDDDVDVRGLMQVMLNGDECFSVIGQAGDGAEAVRLAELSRPDVVVLDLHMPGGDGLAALPLLRACVPDSRIVVVSAFPDPYTFCEVVKQGADGYLDKTRTAWELLPALRAICEVG